MAHSTDGVDWADGFGVRRPAREAPPPRPWPAGAALRGVTVVFGVLGVAGAVYLALTLPAEIDRRRAAAEGEAFGAAMTRASGSSSRPATVDQYMQEWQRAHTAAMKEEADEHAPHFNRLTTATYVLLGGAVLGMAGCGLVATGRGLVAGPLLLAGYVLPLVVGRDWMLLVYPLGLAVAGGLAFFVGPGGTRPPKRKAEADDEEDDDDRDRRPARGRPGSVRRKSEPDRTRGRRRAGADGGGDD